MGTSGEVKILSTSNDFKNLLIEVKQGLKENAAQVEKDIDGKKRVKTRLEQEIIRLQEAIKEAGGERKSQLDKQLENTKLDLASAESFIETQTTKLQGLQERVEAVNKPEAVGTDISSYIISINGGQVKVKSVSATEITGDAILPLSSEQEQQKGQWTITKVSPPESERKLSDKEIIWLDKLNADGLVNSHFNTQFFTSGASREAEVAGIWGAVVGTFYTMLVTLALVFPIGVGAAIYLEEFAPKNKITDMIEVNINNLAAVPSIVFGLLGLAMFLKHFWHAPVCPTSRRYGSGAYDPANHHHSQPGRFKSCAAFH